MENVPDTRLFRDIFNASPLGIAVEDLDGQPLFVNPALCSLLGFSEEELRSKHCVDFSPPEDAERDWALFQQLRAGSIDRYQIEKRYFRRDGSLMWGSLSISLLEHMPPLIVAMVQDITEKKKAEEARFRHAAIVESSEDAIASTTLDGVIVSWNAGAQRIFGYTEIEAVGQSVTILVPPELPDEENKILQTLKAGGRIEQFETVRVTKAGKRINVSLSISPIKDSTGRIMGCSGIARDITARRQAEDVLRESEERFRLAARAGKMYAYDWNAKTNEVVRSPEFVEVLGLAKPEPLSDGQFLNGIHPDDRSRFLAEIGSLTPEKPNRDITYRFLSPRGGIVWLKSSGHALFDGDGNLQKVVGMVTDVTEQKLNEDRLREYEKAVETAEEMIAVVDREYRYLIANRNYLKMRNMTAQQVIGRFAHEVLNRGVFEAVVKDKLDECFQGRVVRYEIKYAYPEIGERDVFVSYFPIEGTGEIDGVVCIARDITEQKQAEQALASVSRKLIEAQEQERARIARELHDDFSQRIALLAVNLEGVRQGLVTSEGAAKRRIEEACQRVAELGSDIQALSHQLHSSKLEYLGLEVAAASFCKEFSMGQNVETRFHSEDIPKEIPAETALCLFRVLQEALQNASKHSGTKQFEVSLKGSLHEIDLTVHDPGVGFDAESVMSGQGLGLTSMRERLKLVGGKLSIDSKLVGGTTIHACVPFSPKAKSGAAD
jgi:PAS domain S-box-containing protein